MELNEIKHKVLTHFSNENYPCCKKCGYNDIRALCLDHIDGNGNKHRKKGKYLKGINLYKHLLKNNFKCEYNLQTLCFNCNQIKVFDKFSKESTAKP